MQSPPLLKARLVHAEPGSRVVEASAWRGEHCIGSCLGEAADAEQAEQRARQRLQEQLQEQPAAAPVREAPPAAMADPEPEPATAPAASHRHGIDEEQFARDMSLMLRSGLSVMEALNTSRERSSGAAARAPAERSSSSDTPRNSRFASPV